MKHESSTKRDPSMYELALTQEQKKKQISQATVRRPKSGTRWSQEVRNKDYITYISYIQEAIQPLISSIKDVDSK